MAEASHPTQAVVQVRGLSKRFGRRTALGDLTLSVGEGEVTALLGANGGGKSTALRLLAGVLRPDGGAGSVLGCDLFRPTRAMRRQLGFQPQNFALPFDLTVRESLRFRADAYALPRPRQAVEQALADHGLESYADRLAGRLSSGWRNRLQLAATLLHEPRLVLLDEPTAGLDVLARARTWERIFELAVSGVSVIISTHDLEEAERCTRVAFFAEGAVLACAAPQALALDPALAVTSPLPPSAPALARAAAALLAAVP